MDLPHPDFHRCGWEPVYVADLTEWYDARAGRWRLKPWERQMQAECRAVFGIFDPTASEQVAFIVPRLGGWKDRPFSHDRGHGVEREHVKREVGVVGRDGQTMSFPTRPMVPSGRV